VDLGAAGIVTTLHSFGLTLVCVWDWDYVLRAYDFVLFCFVLGCLVWLDRQISYTKVS